jgi:hypothetical protein
MSNKNVWKFILISLTIAGFIWALSERNKRIEVEGLLEEKEDDYLQLLQKYLEKEKSIPEEIKQQLIKLRKKYLGIDDAIAIELKKVIDALNIGQEETAIFKLTKIIENILKEKFEKEEYSGNKKSFGNLASMLKEALNLKWISKHEYYISYLLKDQRNKEGHELAIKFPDNWVQISFLAGIELIYNLKGTKRA